MLEKETENNSDEATVNTNENTVGNTVRDREDSATENGEQIAAAALDEAVALETLRAENATLKDRLLRALAEAENTRRRADQERRDQSRYSIAPLARELLPVMDNLERALATISGFDPAGAELIQGFVVGIDMTAKQLSAVLATVSVERIDPSLGAPFDYRIHQAMSEATDTGYPAGTVAMVAQPGYRLHDRLLRPAMVVVSKDVAPTKEPEE